MEKTAKLIKDIAKINGVLFVGYCALHSFSPKNYKDLAKNFISKNKICSLDVIIGDIIKEDERISKHKMIDGYNLACLAKAMIDVESEGESYKVSCQGAVGLMQLIPQTIKDINRQIGENYSLSEMKNPELNIRYGLYHLLQKYSEYKDKKEGEKIKFAIGGYLGMAKGIKNNPKIKSWNQAICSTHSWPSDKLGNNAKTYVDKVFKKYNNYNSEKKRLAYRIVNFL